MKEPRIVRLDVRQEIASGGAPCSRIMQVADQLQVGDTLELIAPFEPAPLYDLLGRQGFEHEAHELDAGDWEIRFTRSHPPDIVEDSGSGGLSSPASEGCGSRAGPGVELDVRGLEPPQPMVRILETIEDLPAGTTLHALTDRQPLHLLDQLASRGLSSKTDINPGGGYITHIQRP